MLSQTPPAHNVHSLHSFPQQSHHINCTFKNSISRSYYRSFINFRNSLLATLAKLIHWHLPFFSLKLCFAVLTLWNLDNGLATALCKPHLPSQAMPPISHLPISVCHLPLTYAQILKLWRKEPFSFGVCSTTHCTMKSWSFMWVSKCCSNVLQQSLTLGLDYVLHKASSTASRP